MVDWKEEIIQRLASLKLEPTREAEIVEEMAQHLEDRYNELVAAGATKERASRAAFAELSESELLQRELRRVEKQIRSEPFVLGTNRRTNLFSDLWQDLRFGVRLFVKLPRELCREL